MLRSAEQRPPDSITDIYVQTGRHDWCWGALQIGPAYDPLHIGIRAGMQPAAGDAQQLRRGNLDAQGVRCMPEATVGVPQILHREGSHKNIYRVENVWKDEGFYTKY